MSFSSNKRRVERRKKKELDKRIKDGKLEYQLDIFIMHLLRQQQQQKQLFCLVFIFITQTISVPLTGNYPKIQCNILHQNCTVIPRNPSSNSNTSNVHVQGPAIRATASSTSRFLSTTRTSSLSDFDGFSENLKRAALILAGIALGLGILRICLMLCKSRSSTNSISNRHSATVRPQISTIEHHQFKPDVPPAYAEAIAYMENDEGKLPAYEELPYEQQQEQHVYNYNGYTSTQM